jgi:EAL domain-containing protein (putative c-di-GMP-specific phosphodiesterase class I)
LLPLHLNLMADTVVAEGETLAPLHHALSGTGRQARQTVLEINPSHVALKPELFFAGLKRLRSLGYRIALDGVGAGNYPLTVIAEARPDLIKWTARSLQVCRGNAVVWPYSRRSTIWLPASGRR